MLEQTLEEFATLGRMPDEPRCRKGRYRKVCESCDQGRGTKGEERTMGSC